MRKLFDAAFIPGVRAPMCVGLGNPEMRTLITYLRKDQARPPKPLLERSAPARQRRILST
ncbi:MAG: hypothetical protein ABWY38_07730 [Methyloceanibacter sp.]